jgi:hypothetical protein
MDLALHFLHINRLDFHLKKKILPSSFEKLLWSNNFIAYVLNARQPLIEKSGPYCFIGMGPLKNQPPPSH